VTTLNSTSDPSIAENLALGDGRKRGRRVIVFLVIGLLVLAAVLWWVWWQGANGENRIQYKTEVLQRGKLTITVTATGNLEPTNQIEVGSELSGIIESVAVDYNDHVSVGQPLAVLNTTKLKAKVLQSKASLASARAKVLSARATADETRSQVNRLIQLRAISGSKAVSQQDLDTAQATLDRALADEAMAKAAVELAQAILEADETDLSKAVIVSPINGIVLSRDVDPGQTVAASLQAPVLFTLAEDLARMELIVDVDEADVGLIKDGQDAEFTVDAYPDRRYPAHITQVRFGAKTVDGVVTYATVLNVDNSDLSLRPGMTATATITVQKIEDALLVPNAALRFAPSGSDMPATTRSRGLIGSLIPRPPRPSSRQRPAGEDHAKRQRVWTLRDQQLVPIFITIGPSDGTRTVVTGGELGVDTPVVVDMVKVSS
jgi:HlyD family secretion protein